MRATWATLTRPRPLQEIPIRSTPASSHHAFGGTKHTSNTRHVPHARRSCSSRFATGRSSCLSRIIFDASAFFSPLPCTYITPAPASPAHACWMSAHRSRASVTSQIVPQPLILAARSSSSMSRDNSQHSSKRDSGVFGLVHRVPSLTAARPKSDPTMPNTPSYRLVSPTVFRFPTPRTHPGHVYLVPIRE